MTIGRLPPMALTPIRVSHGDPCRFFTFIVAGKRKAACGAVARMERQGGTRDAFRGSWGVP